MTDAPSLVERLRPVATIISKRDEVVRAADAWAEEKLAAALAEIGLSPEILNLSSVPAAPVPAIAIEARATSVEAVEAVPLPVSVAPERTPEPEREEVEESVAAEPVLPPAAPPIAPPPPASLSCSEVNALIKRFRATGRLQRELAEATGATAPQISAYLSSRSQPAALGLKIRRALDLWEEEAKPAEPRSPASEPAPAPPAPVVSPAPNRGTEVRAEQSVVWLKEAIEGGKATYATAGAFDIHQCRQTGAFYAVNRHAFVQVGHKPLLQLHRTNDGTWHERPYSGRPTFVRPGGAQASAEDASDAEEGETE